MVSDSITREKRLLEYLQSNESASIQELAEALGVSNMTVHRDLNRLAETGQVRKKHGGATLHREIAGKRASSSCDMCGKTVSQRTIFTVKFKHGEMKTACCAHCGLMLHSNEKDAWQSLTADFLYGHMISAEQAYYLIGSQVNVCCVPSLLSFGSKEDAQKFQRGFGGKVAKLREAVQYLSGLMHAHK